MLAIVRAVRERRITRATLPRDLLAGLVVGVVAVPLAMAFAIASGLKPEQGLVTGIVAGVLVSLCGGSQVQIGGPTGAFIVILLGVVHDHGVAGLQVAGMLAGVILVVLGLAGLGKVIRYIPHPVVVGFTAGIGVVIFTGQIPDFLGLQVQGSARDFVHKAAAIGRAFPTVSVPTALLAAFTLAVILFYPLLTRRIPAPLVGMLAGTAACMVFHPRGVATIGSAFGAIEGRFPAPRIPPFDWSHIGALLAPAFTIAMLGAIESLLSAVVADGMTGDTHDSDQELIGQGVANVASPLFGGFPATGAIARTATSVRNGGRSPVAGLVHAAVLLAVMLVLAPFAVHVPLACLAAILFVVAWNMSEVHAVATLLTKGAWSDRVVLVVTFVLTVFVDLVVAVEVGVVLAALLFMKHMAEQTQVKALLTPEEAPDPHHGLAVDLPKGIALYSVDGPFFFGVAHRFENTVAAVDPEVHVVIVRMWRVPYLDATGENALRRAVEALRRGGRRVVLSGVNPQVRAVMERSGLADFIGREKIWDNLEESLAFARELLAEERRKALTRRA